MRSLIKIFLLKFRGDWFVYTAVCVFIWTLATNKFGGTWNESLYSASVQSLVSAYFAGIAAGFEEDAGANCKRRLTAYASGLSWTFGLVLFGTVSVQFLVGTGTYELTIGPMIASALVIGALVIEASWRGITAKQLRLLLWKKASARIKRG